MRAPAVHLTAVPFVHGKGTLIGASAASEIGHVARAAERIPQPEARHIRRHGSSVRARRGICAGVSSLVEEARTSLRENPIVLRHEKRHFPRMNPVPLNTLVQTELLTAEGSVCVRGYLLMKDKDSGFFYAKVTTIPDATPAVADILNHGKRPITECRKSEPGRMTEYVRLRLGE